MRIIIKYLPADKTWSNVFLIETIFLNEEVPQRHVIYTGGFISNAVFEQMKKQELLQEVDAVEIIDKYYRSEALITDAKSHKYFELKNSKQ